ncbi:MAG: hypothetical protein ACREFX_10725 [Opitutaceae bacterium]
MKRIPLVLALGLLAAGTGGCSHIPFFGRKKAVYLQPGKLKPSKHIATDVEKEFESRWVDQRTSDLINQGLTPEAARAQAVNEFKLKFPATGIAKQLP